MDRDLTQFVPREGMTVYGSDGDKVGEVDAVETDYFVVRKGFFFPEDHYIPLSAVNNADEDNIYLAYTKDQVLEQQWTTAPDTNIDPATTGNYNASEAVAVDTTGSPGEDWAADTDAVDRQVADVDDTTIDVHEEELVANRRAVDRGAVRIEKDVVAEERTLEVPVTEERVRVERRVVDRPVTATDADAFEDTVIDVPLRTEAVDVQKQARVAEEVVVSKEAEQRTERVSDTVRREEVVVDEEDAVDATLVEGRTDRP